MNEELMQEIKATLPWFIVAALAVGLYYGVKNYRENRRVESSGALVSSYTTDDFEAAVQKFGSTDAGGALNLRLAKKYYDDGRYEEAIEVYDRLAANAPDGYADIPAVGKAQCLEAQGKYAEAQAAYEKFAGENAKSFLALTAKLGVARTIALGGDKEKALAKLAEIKESVKDEAMAKTRVESAEDLVRRYSPKAAKAADPVAEAIAATAAEPAASDAPAAAE